MQATEQAQAPTQTPDVQTLQIDLAKAKVRIAQFELADVQRNDAAKAVQVVQDRVTAEQAAKNLRWTTKYWCAMPTANGSAHAEYLAGCGRWADASAFWMAGVGLALVWTVVTAATLTWWRKWEDEWPWLLVAIAMLILWWVLSPLMVLAFAAGAGYLALRGVREGLDWNERRLSAGRAATALALRERVAAVAQVEQELGLPADRG